MKNIITGIFLLLTSGLSSQAKTDKIVKQIVIDVVYLSSDYMEGRHTGSRGEDRAAEYIMDRFQVSGLVAGGKDNQWFQPFNFSVNNPHGGETGERLNGKNVIGLLDNRAENTIVLGAHYDHLGFGETGAMDAHDKGIHNGADDNASGIAALFYMADLLQEEQFNANNYLFIAFSGEEQGLHGSKAFTADPSIDLETINFMINMDMVGRLEKEKPLLIYGVGTSPSWRSVLDVMWVDGISGIKTMDDGIGPSDHTSFYLKNIPVLHFFTGQHQDYHKSSDDASLVNFDGIKLVGDYIVGIIDAVKDEDKLTFSKTKSTERKGAAFKVTLGVMPDYTHEGMGMKIDAVLEERPAQAAGLKDGDLIIEMDGKEIADIYTYMEVLSKHKKGDTIPVVVKRGEETVKVKVTF
ncbi:MAG: hypothetical protein ACI8XB_002566 [Patiriisocius sp.]|jgi:hypothetical protein